MLDALASLLAFAAIALAAYGLGRPLTRALRLIADDWFEETVWSFALGLLAAGMLLTAWGMLGGLSTIAIRWLTLTAAIAGLVQAAWPRRCDTSLRLGVFASLRSHPDDVLTVEPPRWLIAGLFALMCLAAGAALVNALAPTVAGDALCYHLEIPKQFLVRGEIRHWPYHDNSTFPLLAEMFFLWALALDSAVAAQLVHWGLGVLLGAATVLLARPVVGRQWAWAAGCLAILVPGITNQMGAPLNDVALAAFTTLALVAWQKGVGSLFSRPLSSAAAITSSAKKGSRPRFLWLCGLMLGAALGIKYTAILFLAAIAAVTGWTLLRDVRPRLLLKRGLTIATVAVAIGGVWYLRAAYHRGNPVYPFFSAWLGEEGPSTLRDSKKPLKWSVVDLATAPWQVTMNPERFGGRGHQLGGLFLAALPAVFVVRRHRLRPLLAVAAVYGLLWYGLRQNVRFLFPVVPLLTIAAVCALAGLARWPRMPRLLSAGACGFLVIVMAAPPLLRVHRYVPVALGLESRVEFLRRHEPTYPVAQFVNERLPADARLLSQEHRAFYFQREMTRENIFRRKTAYHKTGCPHEALASLRAAGFTHLLLAENEGPGVQYNPVLTQLADSAVHGQGRSMRVLFAHSHCDADGTPRRYRLLEL